MPSRGIMRAKQKRAASLGQSARFYLLGVPKQVAKKGYVKVADIAWFVHPFMCFGISVVYGWGAITAKLQKS